VIDDALRTALRKADAAAADARAAKWAEENAEAIEDYNRRMRERGLIGEEFRKW
jgi:antitoxin CcdA